LRSIIGIVFDLHFAIPLLIIAEQAEQAERMIFPLQKIAERAIFEIALFPGCAELDFEKSWWQGGLISYIIFPDTAYNDTLY
jgi:hypothetical protein